MAWTHVCVKAISQQHNLHLMADASERCSPIVMVAKASPRHLGCVTEIRGPSRMFQLVVISEFLLKPKPLHIIEGNTFVRGEEIREC